MNIGQVKLENRLILAPLAGMLRLSLRMTYRRLGAAMTCVGVIDARAMVEGKSNGLINILGGREVTNEEERPVSVQLIGSHVGHMAEAARRIQKRASIIDLNFSGPLRYIIEQGYGAAGLLKSPDIISRIVAAVVKSVSVPVTAKIRIGFEGNDVDVLRVARTCQDAGASALTVHARSASEGYAGPVHWDWIRQVKESVNIPVIGNGGVHSAADAKAMLDRTGCDFVMIGTSAIIDPMIFHRTNRYLETGILPAPNRVLDLIRFLREYRVLAKRIDSRGLVRFIRRACRSFFRTRSFMEKIKTGRVTLERHTCPSDNKSGRH